MNARFVAFLAVAAVMVVAFLVRTLGFEFVFVGDEVVFPPADPQYHLRRALYSLERFPSVLLFDPYINFPGGAAVAWPPLYDLGLGFAGRLFGGSIADLERVAAWSGPVLAVLTLPPIYLAGALLHSGRAGWLAALFVSALPISVSYTRVGNADHHAAVAMWGAWLLYACLGLVDPEASRRRIIALGGLLLGVTTALLFTWHGSLLYLLPASGLLLCAAISSGRRGLLGVLAIAAFGAAGAVALFLSSAPEPLGGFYSAIALSWLHVLALCGVGAIATGLLAVGATQASASITVRGGLAVGLGVVYLGAILLLPEARAGLEPALRFLTLGDQVGAVTGEQSPLFAVGGRVPGRSATLTWGAFAYVLPVLPFAAFLTWRADPPTRGRRWAGAWLFVWGLLFCGLATLQRRYGNDAAPAAALLIALALVFAAEAVLGRLRVPDRARPALALVLGALVVVLSYASVLRQVYVPRARASLAASDSPVGGGAAARSSIAFTLHDFLGRVRELTPETSGYFDEAGAPEYGVIAHANLGHAIQYRARRATATDPFWWFIGRENWDRSFDFLEATDEQQALAIARSLSARYVITMPGDAAGTVMARLHDADGRAEDELEPLHHFRLVAEAPPGLPAVSAIFGGRPGEAPPYKLFEIVPGAVVEVGTQPGQAVVLSATIEVSGGRQFVYQIAERAGPDGMARFRVPYSTDFVRADDAGDRVRVKGTYRVRDGMRLRALHVSEEAVLNGDTVSVERSLGAPMPDASILRRP